MSHYPMNEYFEVGLRPCKDLECMGVVLMGDRSSQSAAHPIKDESLQKLVDQLWDIGIKPSAVKAVAEAKPANLRPILDDLLETNLAAILQNTKVLLRALGVQPK